MYKNNTADYNNHNNWLNSQEAYAAHKDVPEYITEEDYETQELTKIQEECSKYGYKASLQFGEIHIKTKFEYWYFNISPNSNGCIKLMHGNGIGADPRGYHKQFTRKMDYHGVVQYVHEHEMAKYCGKPIDFTFTKTGAYRKALA